MQKLQLPAETTSEVISGSVRSAQRELAGPGRQRALPKGFSESFKKHDCGLGSYQNTCLHEFHKLDGDPVHEHAILGLEGSDSDQNCTHRHAPPRIDISTTA